MQGLLSAADPETVGRHNIWDQTDEQALVIPRGVGLRVRAGNAHSGAQSSGARSAERPSTGSMPGGLANSPLPKAMQENVSTSRTQHQGSILPSPSQPSKLSSTSTA